MADRQSRALAEVASIMASPPPEGQLHEALANLAYRCAEAGADNDLLLRTLVWACNEWGMYASTYQRWKALMDLLRRVRSEFPSSAEGVGWKPPRGKSTRSSPPQAGSRP